jgi:hypothetical protein
MEHKPLNFTERNLMLQKPKLLDCVRDVLRLKHYSYRTEQSYVAWIRRYILFHNKQHPKDMTATHIQAFLTHLAVNGKVTASTQNQALKSSYWFLVLSCWLGALFDRPQVFYSPA